MSLVGVIDYGLGNLPSVTKALERSGARVRLCAEPSWDDCDALVLPGVGHFGAGARLLDEGGFSEPIRKWVAAGRPLLGICVGLQLLFASSQEDPQARGLGIVDGHVRKLAAPGLKVPHMGWNQLVEPRAVLSAVGGERVYFVHSYAVEPADPGVVAARVTYGSTFCAAIQTGALVGVQFHPEKSGDAGRRMLQEWVDGI